MKKIALHWQIIIGIVLGIIVGFVLSFNGWASFGDDWIAPFGDLFINGLKLIAVPLVLVSLISGISGLSDISKLSSMGGKTIILYLSTTIIAVAIGLLIVNVVKPGELITEEKRIEFKEKYAEKTAEKIAVANAQKDKGPLQPLVDMVSSNIFNSFTDNRNMLQVIVFAVLFSVAMVNVDEKYSKPIKVFFEGLNEIIVMMVQIIMKSAPYCVFAMMVSLITSFAGNDPASALELFKALGLYSLCVLVGLGIMIFGVYPAFFLSMTKVKYVDFFKAIMPAQLMAFSTSSSAATLPVTMKCVEEDLGVSDETTSFVLPMGATMNMDGTSLYQGVAAVFIAQATGYDLDFSDQLAILGTAVLASIGSAAVPGAGTVMLAIVLGQINVPESGIALILAPDRLLDMCRTIVNVTGDSTVSLIVDKK